MSRKQPGIVIYRMEYASIRDRLSYEQKGQLLDSLIDFSEGGKEYQGGDPFVSMAFAFFSAAIRRAEEQYENRSRANRGNANQRWHPDDDEPDANDANDANDADDANRIDGMQSLRIAPTKPNVPEPNIPKRTKRTQTLFIPPSVDEVATYCRERGNEIDPEAFVSYYQRQGWELSNGRKMRDWRSAIITWEKNRKGETGHELRGACLGNPAPGQRSEYMY